MSRKKLLLIDKMSIMHRSYHAFINLKSKKGEPTGGFFGFVKRLKELIDNYAPDLIIVCSDLSRKDLVRKEWYSLYKENRSETEDALKNQFPLSEEYLEKCNIIHIAKKGFEGDDLIGTLALEALKRGFEPFIVSGDRDLFQLISEDLDVPGIKQLFLGKDGIEEITSKEVTDKFGGLLPSQIVDFKALAGDNSDNIPGVTGWGEKTAITALLKYETLDNIYEHVEDFKGKKKENLINDKEKAYISQKLAKIMTNVDLPFDELFIERPFSPCTTSAYEMLKSLDIFSIFKAEDVIDIAIENSSSSSIEEHIRNHVNFPIEVVSSTQEEFLEDVPIESLCMSREGLPFDLIDINGEIHFTKSLIYSGSVSKEALAMLFYEMQTNTDYEEMKEEFLSLGKTMIELEKQEVSFSNKESQQTQVTDPIKPKGSVPLGPTQISFF